MKRISLSFATRNEHKLQEIKNYLGDKYLVKGLEALGINQDIPETGASFRENALIKTNFLFSKFHTLSLAEDSGLVVPSLNGAPGIFSARYAANTNLSNIQLLLKNLTGEEKRTAYYISVIALKDNNSIAYFEGKCHGKISLIQKGTGGFGYDPVFIPDGYDKTFGELNSIIKLKISHRTKAIKQLIHYLNQ